MIISYAGWLLQRDDSFITEEAQGDPVYTFRFPPCKQLPFQVNPKAQMPGNV